MNAPDLPGVDTPQFRTLLLRKLKNAFPSCSARIAYTGRGVAFQLFDDKGDARSAVINVGRARADLLTKTSLKRLIRNEGEPKGRFPLEMTQPS
jgi:hypothetical protein